MGGAYSSEEGQAQTDGQKSAGIDARPTALVVCGPSGVGKGTLIKKLMEGSPRLFGFSCSHTTRTPRQGEEVRNEWVARYVLHVLFPFSA